jgi:hypothetical protein
VDNTTNEYVEIVHSKSIISYNTTQSVGGKQYHFVPYDYQPQWYYKSLWKLKSWYNLPRKIIIRSAVISIASKLLGKLVLGLIITVLGGVIILIIWALFETELTQYFGKYKL